MWFYTVVSCASVLCNYLFIAMRGILHEDSENAISLEPTNCGLSFDVRASNYSENPISDIQNLNRIIGRVTIQFPNFDISTPKLEYSHPLMCIVGCCGSPLILSFLFKCKGRKRKGKEDPFRSCPRKNKATLFCWPTLCVLEDSYNCPIQKNACNNWFYL